MKDEQLKNEIERYFKKVIKKNPMEKECCVKPGRRAEILSSMATQVAELLAEDMASIFTDFDQAIHTYDCNGIMGKLKFPVGIKTEIIPNGPGHDVRCVVSHNVKHSIDSMRNVGGTGDTPDMFNDENEGATGAADSNSPAKPKGKKK